MTCRYYLSSIIILTTLYCFNVVLVGAWTRCSVVLTANIGSSVSVGMKLECFSGNMSQEPVTGNTKTI